MFSYAFLSKEWKWRKKGRTGYRKEGKKRRNRGGTNEIRREKIYYKY
jgi:hypothetical protein